MPAPEGYGLLPKGVRCRCAKLWQEADGTYWCCTEGKVPGVPVARDNSVFAPEAAQDIEKLTE